MLQGIFNRPELIAENRTCFAVPFLAPDRRHLQAVLDAIVGQCAITPVLMGCPEPVDEIALGVIFSARQFTQIACCIKIIKVFPLRFDKESIRIVR